MNAKLLKLAGGSVLAVMLLAGCGGNNDPAVEDPTVDDSTVEDPAVDNSGDGDVLLDENPESQDKNTDGDMDPAKDENTPEEDVIEDQKDMQDADNKDS